MNILQVVIEGELEFLLADTYNRHRSVSIHFKIEPGCTCTRTCSIYCFNYKSFC